MNCTKINELVEKINQSKKDYYNGVSKTSDILYDSWIDELSELDPKNTALISIGSEPVSNWPKFQHKIQMGSLNKSQTDEEYLKWHNKYIDKDDEVFLTLKLDGLSISLIYENGVLVKAATRGSGIMGELITPNVAKMKGVPLRLKEKIDVTIRGEIVLSKENHQQFFSEYSNPRNAASGISRRYDGTGSDKLTILTYQIFSDNLQLNTQEEQFNTLTKLGFLIPPYYVLKSFSEVCNLKKEYQSLLRDKFSFELDGLVAHNNNLSKQESYGSLNGRPYASIAIKFDSVAKEGKISEILIQVGNSGRLTPVAVFNPKINLMGAEIEKASLHNFSNINELGIDIGAKVLVCRSNDVIPYIEEVSESTGTIFPIPTTCPQCGSLVVISGEYVQCPNYSSCPAQLVGRIKNWIKELNILEWGDALIQRLVETEKVKTVADLYKLSIEDLEKIDRMGKKSAQKCYNILHANKELPLEIFLGGLSIPMIGQSTIKLIMSAGYDNLEKFQQLNAIHFEQITGVGPVKAKSLFDGLKINQQLIFDILNSGVKIRTRTIGKLIGTRIAITGSTNLKRSELEKFISDNGGEYKSSVGKSCTHLISNEKSESTKTKSALKLGIKVISEDELLNMVNDG